MRFYTSVVAVAAFAANVIAQSANLPFTSVPSSVTAGQSVTITYTASDSADPVTITLRKGDPNNLQTISTLTSTSTGGSYTWNVPTTLPDGDDYALQITQGNLINYSGEFPLTGGSSSSSSASASSTSSLAGYSSSMSMPMSSMSSLSTYMPMMTTTPVAYNTTVKSAGTIVYPGTVSAGASTAMGRNTTMSYATLTASSGSSGATAAASTSGAGYQSTSSSPSAPAFTGGAASGISGGSPLALVLAAVAGVLI